MVRNMRKNLLGTLTVALLILALEIPLGTPMSAEPPKTVFSRWYNYSPTGHWNIFIPGSISLLSVVQESLTHYFPANGSYVPGLAVNWTYQDYSVFTLKLRKGAKWHDGTEFTALDVWATWHALYLLKDRAWYYLKNITITDSHTLVFYMKERNDYCPFYILWHWVAVPYSHYGVLASRVYSKILEGYDILTNSTPFNDLVDELKNLRPPLPIGTGPYKFKSMSETEIVLERFDDYWGTKPHIDEVRYVRQTSVDVGWTMLADGQFSFHWALPTKEQHQLVVGKPWVKIIPVARPVGVTMYFNNRIYPLSLKEVRQAIAHAINRSEIAIIRYPAGGTAQKYNAGFNEAGLYATLNETFINQYIKPFAYDYNLTKAEQILKGLGCTKDTDGIYKTPNGTRLEFELKTDGAWLNGPSMEAIAAQLAQIGIKINLRIVDTAVYFANDGDFYQGRYQIGAGVFGGADFSFDEYYHKYVFLFPGHGFAIMQKVPWRTELVNLTHITKVMQTYPAGCSLSERDEYRAILSYITASQVPVLSLFTPTAYMYLNVDKFSGWPPADDIYWQGLGSYEAHGSSYMHRWLMLKPSFSLKLSGTPAAGGTTSPATGTLKYAKGTAVTVTATPASGFTFKNWILDGATVTGASIKVTMDIDHVLQAVFEAKQSLTISVNPAGGGTTNPATGTYSHAKGDKVTVAATPTSGFNFKEWKLDGASRTGTSIEVTMDTSHTLEAVFEQAPPYALYAGIVIAAVAVVAVVAYMMRRRKPPTG